MIVEGKGVFDDFVVSFGFVFLFNNYYDVGVFIFFYLISMTDCGEEYGSCMFDWYT